MDKKKKKYKKPRHTNLVVSNRERKKYKKKEETVQPTALAFHIEMDMPGEDITPVHQIEPVTNAPKPAGDMEHDAKVDADSEINTVAAEQKKEVFSKAKQQSGHTQPKLKRQAQSNTVKMPRRESPMQQVKRKKRKRRLQMAAVLLLILFGVSVYMSGFYLTVGNGVSTLAESLRIAVRPGSGFPMEFGINSYKNAQQMGTSSIAVLGEKDLVVVSSNGAETLRVQHGYVNPQMTTGKTRVCVYNRGSKEYSIEGRTRSLLRDGTTEHDILFAEMSDDGYLAMVTSSGKRHKVEVFSPVVEQGWQFRWESSKDEPISAAFSPDNKTIALGTVTTEGGELASTVYVMRTNKNPEKAQTAAIKATGAIPVKMQYMSGNRLLVIYDKGYAAIYTNKGEEVAVYQYGNSLHTQSIGGGAIALLFGSGTQDSGQLVLLSESLQPLGEIKVEAGANAQLLCTRGGVLVRSAQEVAGYSLAGEKRGTAHIEEKVYGLVGSKAPLLVVAGSIKSLDPLLKKTGVVDIGSVSSSGPASMSSVARQEISSKISDEEAGNTSTSESAQAA